MTSDKTLTLNEVVQTIYEKVESYRKEKKLNKNDIWQIVQIFDTDEEKELYSIKFYEMFEGREKLFIKYLESDVVNGCPDSFPASWKYIKEELHSLERHSNLHIYFKENPYLYEYLIFLAQIRNGAAFSNPI